MVMPLATKVAFEPVLRHGKIIVVRLVVTASVIRVDILLALIDLHAYTRARVHNQKVGGTELVRMCLMLAL